MEQIMSEITIFIGQHGPYFVNCYYCGKEVTAETHGWNAVEHIKQPDGNWKNGRMWLVHGDCLRTERNAIRVTRDWKRGEAFDKIHTLYNPLSIVKYRAKCGCIIEEWYHTPDRTDTPSYVEDKRCWRHDLKIRQWSRVISFLHLTDLRRWIDHRQKDWYEKWRSRWDKHETRRSERLRKMIETGTLIDEPMGVIT